MNGDLAVNIFRALLILTGCIVTAVYGNVTEFVAPVATLLIVLFIFAATRS